MPSAGSELASTQTGTAASPCTAAVRAPLRWSCDRHTEALAMQAVLAVALTHTLCATLRHSHTHVAVTVAAQRIAACDILLFAVVCRVSSSSRSKE